MKEGDYVRIVNDPVTKMLNGFVGRITSIEMFNGRSLFKIEAENFGPYMGSHGGKTARAWVRGNWRRVHADAIELIT